MTPLNQIDNLYFKREDLNQTGSAKDRAIKVQIDNLLKNKFQSAVISSTGNAAISAIYFCHQNNVPLTVFLSTKVNSKKLSFIKQNCDKVFLSKKPISDAFKYSKENNSYFLRQSTDPQALLGYQQISSEIIDQIPQASSIFIPVGSGATLLGISQKLPSKMKIFAIQPASYCPISSFFDKNYTAENTTSTDALSAKYLPLKNKVLNAIKLSKGQGIVVQDQEVKNALSYLQKININCSPEGALTYAGYIKAQKNNYEIGSHPVILITGTKR
jgi:threonine dehydratase